MQSKSKKGDYPATVISGTRPNPARLAEVELEHPAFAIRWVKRLVSFVGIFKTHCLCIPFQLVARELNGNDAEQCNLRQRSAVGEIRSRVCAVSNCLQPVPMVLLYPRNGSFRLLISVGLCLGNKPDLPCAVGTINNCSFIAHDHCARLDILLIGFELWRAGNPFRPAIPMKS